jgi:TolA-binding protein
MSQYQADDTLEPPTDSLVQLVREKRGRMSIRQRVQGADALAVRLGANRRPGRWWLPSVVGLGALLLLTVGLALGQMGSSTLSYKVDGGHVGRHGEIEADAGRQTTLRFSDGSEVVFALDANASLQAVSTHGAHVTLSAGAARVDVVHWAGGHWLFDAGPFHINVTGTAFRFHLLPAEQELDIWMERGTVEVSGPLATEAMLLHGGQHLIARVREREMLIRDLEASTTSDGPPAGAPPPSSETPASTGLADAPPGSTDAGRDAHPQGEVDGSTWPALLAAGHFTAILRQAERRGLDACLANSPSGELAALADAARYGRRDDIARRALLAERRRFPQSRVARDAGFLLGRLEEAAQHAGPAREWYDRYLAENPSGTYASEALGRKMTLVAQTQDPDQARVIALEYLRRFPQGAYATRARTLTQAP